MVESVSGVPSSQDPLELAAAKALLAHHALGRMSASGTVAEFSAAVGDFLAAARNIARLVEQAAERDVSVERRRAFALWFGTRVAGLFGHPVETRLDGTPDVYVLRLARGSGPPPFAEEPQRKEVVPRSRPDDFFFDRLDQKPAIILCADYLDRITELLDESKRMFGR